MPLLVFFIVISFVFYFFYKVKFVRSKKPAEKAWYSAKSRIALGFFVAVFGVNQLFLFQTTVTYIVATIFILMGGYSIWMGWKTYRYFLPLAIQEAEQQ